METFKLPTSNFEWLGKKELGEMTTEAILKLPSQDEVGYAFEVDLKYPPHLHGVRPI